MISAEMESAISQDHKNIDHLKAFAIILVVFYHTLFQADISYANITNICLTIGLGDVHVPLFILIAGYLCHKQKIRTFYRKKVFRILIPFLFFSILKLILNNLLDTQYLHAQGIGSQLWDAFVCGQLYWFCYCLLMMFLFAPLLWDRRILQWILLGVMLAANVLLKAFDAELTDIFQLQNVICYSPYFLLGMILSGYVFPGFRQGQSRDHTQKSTPGMLVCTVLSLAGIALTGYLRFVFNVGDRQYLIDYVFGICVMYLLYLLSELTVRGRFTERILRLVGKWSFQIMLLDPFWRIAVYMLVSQFLQAGLLSAVITTLADLALCCVTCMAFRRIPGLSVLTGLKPWKVN